MTSSTKIQGEGNYEDAEAVVGPEADELEAASKAAAEGKSV